MLTVRPLKHSMKPKIIIVTFVWLLLFAGIAKPLFAGWIEDAPDRTIIHVKAANLPDPTRIDPASRAALASLNLFKAKFPEIFAARYRNLYEAHPEIYGVHRWEHVEIVLEPFTGIRVEGVESDLLAIAGGMAPDILYVNFRKSDQYIQNSFLQPLDDYLSTLTTAEINERIHPKLWPVIQRKGPDGNTHIWALPYDGALGKVLLFRKDLFDEHHLPHPNPQWTWEDLLQAARTLTQPEKGIYGIFLQRGKQEAWYWLTFLWSAGGDVMTVDPETDQWTCIFDSPEAAVALDFYIRLCAEKWIDTNGEIRRGYSAKDVLQATTKWNRGEIGMMFAYIDEKLFADINPEVTGMAPVPMGPTGLRGGELNSKMMGLFSGIREPAVRDAAWEYMRFYDSPDSLACKTAILVDSGLGPFINPKYLRQFGYPELLRLAPASLAETFQIAIDSGKPEPYGRNSNVAYELMTIPLAQAEQLALHDELPENRDQRLAMLQQLLGNACTRANEVMMGIRSPEERRLRRWTAGAVLFLMTVVAFFSIRRIVRHFTPPDTGMHRFSFQRHLRRYAWSYVLLLPAALTILVWKYLPLVRGAGMAFYDYRLIGESTFVGLDHFGNMLFDGFWWKSVLNAFRYSFLVIGLTFIPPVLLALLLHEIPKGRRLFRLIYYLPAVVSGLVTMILWKQFYEPSEHGTLNALLRRIPSLAFLLLAALCFALSIRFFNKLRGHEAHASAVITLMVGAFLAFSCVRPVVSLLLPAGENILSIIRHFPARLLCGINEPVRWLSNPDTAMFSCVIPMIWAGMGPGCLIYLAAMKCIPEEFFEAADMDGAGVIDKIVFIVFPQMKMLLMINFIGAFISSWYAAAGNILVMTGGSAGTEVAGLHIWYKAFTFLQFGPATAMAWMLGFILIGFTVQQLTMLSKVEYKSTR